MKVMQIVGFLKLSISASDDGSDSDSDDGSEAFEHQESENELRIIENMDFYIEDLNVAGSNAGDSEVPENMSEVGILRELDQDDKCFYTGDC